MNYQEKLASERVDKDNNKVETVRELAKRHMMDQRHTTTDEELKNAVVELDPEPLVEIKQTTTLSEENK